jgi:hypothetical protein
LDPIRFDTLTRNFTGNASRRGILGTWLAVLGLGTLPPASGVTKQKNRKQKLQRNAFGCVNVGGKCRGNDGNCCSGICDGKKPKKGDKDRSRCAGHDASTCLAGQNTCAGTFFPCVSSRSPLAQCVITTGNASYCAGDVTCRSCARDTDCPPEEFEAGAACIVCGDCAETTACASLRTFG